MRESFVEALKRKYEAEIASAKATAEVSEPPLPKVVMSPSSLIP